MAGGRDRLVWAGEGEGLGWVYWVAGACELGVDETADCWVVDLEFTEPEVGGGVEAWAKSPSLY